MSSTPEKVEPGQIWRDKDERSKGAGEFVVEGTFVGRLSHTAGVEFARIKRSATGRYGSIRVDRLLKGRDYEYIGRSR